VSRGRERDLTDTSRARSVLGEFDLPIAVELAKAGIH
jgi:hypothetical protein